MKFVFVGALYLRSGYILIAPIWPFFELGLKYLKRWDEMSDGSTYFTLVNLQELHDYHITTLITFPLYSSMLYTMDPMMKTMNNRQCSIG